MTHSDLIQENKIRLSNLRQLTFSRENAEAYFSNNGDKLIFQGHDGDSLCDQIYIMNIKTSSINMVSIGEGVTTCSYFVYPDCKKQFMHLLIWETKNVQKNQITAKATYGSFILIMIFFNRFTNRFIRTINEFYGL